MDIKLRVFKAVANEKRIKILQMLHKNGRMMLRDIAEELDVPEATACRNLKILENVGLVKSTINSAIAEYWINNDKNLSINHQILNIILSK